MRKIVWIAVPLVLAAAIAAAWALTRTPGSNSKVAAASYELATVGRASIESVVTSSGTLSPVSSVSVLSQMSGRVEKVYADYNDRVRKGDVLIALNTDMLKLQELQSAASVRKAKANRDLAALDLQNKETLAAKGPRLRLRPQGLEDGGRDRRRRARLGRVLAARDPDPAQPVRPHHLADRRHRARPQRRGGPERRRRLELQLLEPLHPRRGPRAHGDRGGGRRAGHRLDQGGAGRPLYRGGAPRPGLRRGRGQHPPRAGDHRQRRELLR